MKIRLVHLLFFGLFFFHSSILSQDKIARLNNILSLEGQALFKAFDEYRYSDWDDDLPNKKQTKNNNLNFDTLGLYWKVLDKALNSRPKSFEEGYDASSFIEEIVYNLLIKERSNAFTKISSIYKNLSDSSRFKDETILIPLCNYYIFNELEYLIKNKIPPNTSLEKLIDEQVEIPITVYKNELIDEALFYKSLENHYKKRIAQDTTSGWYYVQKNYSSFYKLLEEILFTDSPDHMKNLLMFEWGGWCGTFSESFSQQKEKAELILLLKERDFYSILGSPQLHTHLNQTSLRELIYISGLSWIDLSIGAILNGRFWFLISELNELGGTIAAQKIIEMKDYNFKNAYDKISYLNICTGFLTKDALEKEEYYYGFGENPLWRYWERHLSVSNIGILKHQKDELKNIIINSVKDEDNLDVCQFAIRSLGQLKFDDRIKSVLLKYTKSKFSQVKEDAARILKQKGINVNLPKDNGMLAFKLLVDNKPLSNYDVYWEIFGDSSSYRHTMSSNGKTSENGVLTIPRDIVLSVNKEIQRIRFSASLFENKNNDLLFFYDTSMPNNFFDTTVIYIQTSKIVLNLKLNRNREFYNSKKMNVYIGSYNSYTNLNFSCNIKDLVELGQKIQKNSKYSLQLHVPGSSQWSDFVEITKDTQFIDIDLQHGTNVVFEIVAPGGENSDDEVMFDIDKSNSTWKDLVFYHYDFELKGYQSLPIGEYTLKILSSEEKRIKRESENWSKNEILREYEPYLSKEIKFTITEESPESIDLGIIKLEPVNK